jgi:chromosome partitioning protein
MPNRMDRRHVISFSHIKGGVAKTTSCVNVGAGLANRGYRTLLVDMDPQSSLTDVFLPPDTEPERSIYHVLYQKENSDGKEIPITDVVVNVRENLDLVPATLDLVRLEHLLLPEVDGRDRLRRALRGVDYDFVIVDTSPSVGLLTSNAMIASTDLVVPVQASYFALKGIQNIMETFTTVRERVNEDLNLLGVLVTMVDRRKRHPQEIVDDLREIFPKNTLFDTQIRELAKIEASPGYHKDIFEYAPNSAGADDYDALVVEIIERCKSN